MENKDMNVNVNETEMNETVSVDTGKAIDVQAGKAAELAKLRKSSHVMAVIAKVVAIINYVGCGISFLAALVVICVPQYTNYVVSTGNAREFFPSEAWQELVTGLEKLGDEKWALAAACIATGIGCIVCALIFRYVRKTFNEIENGDTPFTEVLTNRVKVIGIIVTAFVLFGYGIFEAFMAAAIMLTMYMVFRYGFLLQTESDETV